MGLFNFLDPVLDVVFGPLTRIEPLLGLGAITLLVSLTIVMIYRLVTDQKRMKELKETLKKFQEEIKQHKNDPQKMMAKQKEMMSLNMEMMKHSMKPTLFTFIPIIIIFGWLSANFSYYPAMPGEEITTTITFDKDATGNVQLLVPEGVEVLNMSNQIIVNGRASWEIRSDKEGTYELVYDLEGQYVQKDFVVSREREYARASKSKRMLFDFIYSSREGSIPSNAPVREVKIDYRQIKPLSPIGLGLNWLWSYIILSVVFSMVLRKVMKVY